MATIVKDRICRQCGRSFPGGPRAWYCPECRQRRRKDSDARYRAKGRRADRPLGSTDQCVRCGADYTVNSARQKYCPSCAYIGFREVDRPASQAWNQAHKDTYYPARNAKRRLERHCVICGALITAKTPTVTCGDPACKRERLRQRWRAQYAHSHGKPPPEGYIPTK